ncbi:MAG: transcriptional activator NhaR [Dokdonella sp.]
MRRSLNYKHLHYFWAVVRAGGITRAAEKLHLTPQTLSSQIKQLEDSVGIALFSPVGKRLELTESGRVAYSYADEMFSLAAEMSEALKALPAGHAQSFRVGVADAVPKSLAQRLLAPAQQQVDPVRLICREGKLENLLADLALHRLDCVLSIRPVPPGLNLRSWNHKLGGSPIGLFAPRALKLSPKAYPRCLHGQPLLLPGDDSPVRAQLMDWFEAQRLVPRVVAEFDDTALMKTFGRAGAGVFPAPIAIADEISHAYGSLLLGPAGDIEESYYAISTERRVSHPSVRAVIEAASSALGTG